MLLLGINVVVVMVVVFHLYQELSSFVNFLSKTSGHDGFRVTRITRTSSRATFVFFLLTAGLILVLQMNDEVHPFLLVSLGALLVGFLVSGILYQICFINDAGFGSVSPRFEMEIQWNEIDEYAWKDNWLILRLKGKRFARRRIRFHDSEAILAVNDRLKAHVEHALPVSGQ